MGSFSVGCGLSSLSINEGEEIGLVLLSEMKYPHQWTFKFMTSDYDPQYKMFLPPIYGTYDDYGKLANIKRTPTVGLLEKLFRKDIEVVIECISSNEKIYDRSSPVHFHYNKTKAVLGAKLFDQLLAYGMTEVKDDEEESVYTFSNATLTLNKSTERWHVSQTDFQGKEIPLGSIHQFGKSPRDILEFFSKVTKIYPGFAEEDYWLLNQMRNLRGMYFTPEIFTDLTPVMLDDSLRQRWLEYAKTGWDESVKAYHNREGRFYTLSNNPDFDRSFNETYARLYEFVDSMFEAYEKDNNDMMDGYLLKQVMSVANRNFAPSVLGTQFGEDDVSHKMAESMLKVLRRREEERRQEEC